MSDDTVDKIVREFWTAMNQIDARFPVDGMSHLAPKQFIPFAEVEGKWPAIKEAIGSVTAKVRSQAETSEQSA